MGEMMGCLMAMTVTKIVLSIILMSGMAVSLFVYPYLQCNFSPSSPPP